MDKNKRARLEARGWRVGNAADFLELTAEEAALVETKLALSGTVRDRRIAQGLSQAELAKRLHSSQSRVAKIEAADPRCLRTCCCERSSPSARRPATSRQPSERHVAA